MLRSKSGAGVLALICAFVLAALLAHPCPARADLSYDASRAYNTGDYPTAMRLFKQLAAAGDAYALCAMATMHLNGWGTPKDPGEAFRLFGQAAGKGYALGAYNYGVCLRKGLGTPMDKQAALKAFQKVLTLRDQSLVPATMVVLGEMYAQGEGVPRNDAEAYFYYNLAAQLGEVRARTPRDELAKRLTPEQLKDANRVIMRWRED